MNCQIKKNEDFFIKTLESKTSYAWKREHKFLTERRFRFDFACIDLKIAIEVEGGIWSKGRHVRGSGYIRDMEKYNLAIIYGWRLLRYKPDTDISDVLFQIELLINISSDLKCFSCGTVLKDRLCDKCRNYITETRVYE